MTALAHASMLLAVLACWLGGSRSVGGAVALVVIASWLSTLPIPVRLAYALYLLAPAASAWLAMRVASGRGWPAVLAWVVLALWAWVAPRSSPWDAARAAWGYASLVIQLAAVTWIGRPRSHVERAVLVLAAGDVAASVVPFLGWGWWPAQGQCVIVSAALIWIHHDECY